MAAIAITTADPEHKPLIIGPRVRLELEHRIRELEARFKPSPRDLRELASLREFLKVTPMKEQ
jgi:hypothetical protein